MFLNEILRRFEENILKKVESERLQKIYLYLAESELYKLLFLGKGSNIESTRNQIKNFLNSKIDKITIDLNLNTIPADLRSIELDHSDIVIWAENELDRLFYRSIRIKTRTALNLQTDNLLQDMEERITRFGKSIKDLAISVGNPLEGSPKKVYLIPTIQYSHGIGQKTGLNQYVDAALDRILIDGHNWQCWELDGTNNGKNLGLFKFKYEKVIRGLLEGRVTLFIYTVDGEGSYQSISALNILQGALLPNELYFTSKADNFKIFSSIDSFDSDYYEEFSNIMNYFKRYALPLLPIDLSDDPYIPYRKYTFIYDFFAYN